MANVAVIGAQWGDEGKGKVVDWLASRAEIVVRFQGGHNAGHTLVVGDQTYKLSLLPSGLVRGKLGIIGNGVVLDPQALLDEIDRVAAQGLRVTPDTLRIAENTPLILPLHPALDRAREAARGAGAIGTTGRGIGPAYEDKVARRGLRIGDLFNPERFTVKLRELLDYHNFVLQNFYKVEPVDFQKTLDEALGYAEILKPLITDVTARLHELRKQGACIMFEGAQGSLLDIDHGTYPYVTSSSTTAGGTATGSGFGPLYLDYILGITKAYTTRVGSGPFPTELFDDVGARLAERGHEFGSTTGRARRCGWFDAVILRRAIEINSISGICLTKLDVLDGLETIRICVGYKDRNGEVLVDAPTDADSYDGLQPVYEDMPGWSESTVGAKSLDELPANARAYIKRLEELIEAPVDIISTGPDRNETIVLRHPYA